MPTLAQIEQEAASRVGPFALFEVVSGDSQGLTVEQLRSSVELGGWTDLHLLRREATQGPDRLARVKAYDPALGLLQADRQYVSPPAPGELVEVHHLPPDVLRRAVRNGLRRTFCQFWLTLNGVNGGDPGYPSGEAPVVPDTGPVDLTVYSDGWLTLPQQVLDVVDPRWDAQSVPGWQVYQHNGHAILSLPMTTANPGLVVIGSRPYFSLVNGVTTLEGPTEDDDLLDVDLLYAAAFAHVELWRSARPLLESVAAEARQASQGEAAAEATRMAVASAPWLFEPQQTRRARVGALRGLRGALGPVGNPSLAGALVNGPDAMAPTHTAHGAPAEGAARLGGVLE